MGRERLIWLFGPEVLDVVDDHDLADDAAVMELVEEFLPLPASEPYRDLRMSIRTLVANQILIDKPPETWRTAQRLDGLGLGRDEILMQLVSVVGPYVEDMVARRIEWEPDTFAEALDRLPLPDPVAVAREIVEAVRAEPGISAGRLLDQLAVEHDESFAATAERVLDDLAQGALGWLPDDSLVHVPDVVAGRTFTVRPQREEVEMGAIVAGFDLGAFARFDTVRLVDGTQIEQYEPDERMLVWLGDDEWLSAYRPGDLLAVTATVTAPDGGVAEPVDATVSISGVTPEPEMSDQVVAAVRAAYDDLIAGPQVPVSGEELALSLCHDHPEMFGTPQLPLIELCAAAGLEMRDGLVAHDEVIWRRGLTNQRRLEVLAMFGDDEVARPLHEALEVLDDPDADTEDIRAALDGCAEPELVDVFANVLVPHGLDIADRDDSSRADSTGRLFELVDRAIAAARKPRETGVAEYLAGMLYERCGSPDIAEAHLTRAVHAAPDLGPIVERVGWYRFDRGDARGAMRWWSQLEEPPMMSLLKRYASGGGPAHQLGRNDPCWCGSGRKYKVCHQDSTALPALAERYDWLVAKPAVWLHHTDTNVRAGLVDLAGVWMTGDPDADPSDLDDTDPHEVDTAIDNAMNDPALMHVALHEGGLLELFVKERGPILPEDERRLFETWLTIDRGVHEVIETVAGSSIVLRNVTTGETLDVTTTLADAHPGQLWCARVVPDGQVHRALGAMFLVLPGEQDEVLRMCVEHDARGLCAHIGSVGFNDDLE